VSPALDGKIGGQISAPNLVSHFLSALLFFLLFSCSCHHRSPIDLEVRSGEEWASESAQAPVAASVQQVQVSEDRR